MQYLEVNLDGLANSWPVNKDWGIHKASRRDPGVLNHIEQAGNKNTSIDTVSYLHLKPCPHPTSQFRVDMINSDKIVLYVED